MIKLIFLLPFKIIGLLFLAIGAILERREKERIAAARDREKRIAAAQREQERRARADRIAQADRRRAEKERIAADRKKAADLERKKALQFKAAQAGTDIVHYEQQRRELLKLYSELKKQFDAAATDKQKEIVFRKQIALNNQIRGVDKQIEKAQFIINRTG